MTKDKPKAFVIMPFDTELNDVYNLFISKTLTEEGFEVTRADNINNQQNILHDIVGAIIQSDIIVADLTGSNANVFYELGIAHTFDKPVILLTQDIEDVPFDLRSNRLLIYSTHFAQIERAQERLVSSANGFLDGTSRFGNPVTDYRAVYSPESTRNFSAAMRLETNSSEQTNKSEEDSEEDENDDRGFLDHLEAVEQDFTELKEIMDGSTEDIKNLGAATSSVSEELQLLQEDKSSGITSRRRKILHKYSEDVDTFTEKVKNANSRYDKVASSLDTSLEFVVRFQSQSTDNVEALQELLNELAEVKEAATEALISLNGMTDTMDKLPNAERRSNRSLRLAKDEIHYMANNIEKTASSLSRITLLGEEIIDSFESEFSST